MNLNLRLDENFQFLLNFVKKPLSNLGVDSQVIARKWLDKLMGTFEGVEAKRNRNAFLSKLLTCMESGSLMQPFLNLPPAGAVPEWGPKDFPIETPVDIWTKEMLQMNQKTNRIGGKLFRSYLSTKHLANGSCAYVAVSVLNEGAKNSWMHMKDTKMKEHAVEMLFDQILQ